MISMFIDILKLLVYTIWDFGLAIGKTLYQLSGIPTTQYGLVKYILENNILLFDNELLTKIIMFVTPLIISHLIVHLFDFFKIREIKVKEAISLLLYLVILYVFSMWQFWVILASVIIVVVSLYLIKTINVNKKDGMVKH